MILTLHNIIFACLALIFCVAILAVVAEKIKVAYPIFLVIAGLVLSYIPGVPSLRLDPDMIFIVVLPPVLFDASHDISLKALWKWRRMVTVMALGYVLITATAVALFTTAFIPGFTLSQGFLLGAIIAPPDAAAAVAVLKYVKLPKSMNAILEGESLLNDATSLTLFRFALAAILTSNFAWHEAVGTFAFIVISGVAIGLAFGGVFFAIYKWLPTNANIDVALSLVLPYLIYLTAEAVHSSGVLAVVSGGLLVSYQMHFVFSHRSRFKVSALWSSAVFILNAVVFFMIGLQLPQILQSVKSTGIGTAAIYATSITLLIILVRIFAGLASSIFTTYISRYITVAVRRPGWRLPLLSSWMGMRGVVSLASAYSIPLLMPGGSAFPNRDLILFITFFVILATLVGQGLTLPWLVRLVKPQPLELTKSDYQQLLEIELDVYKAAIAEIDTKYRSDVDNNSLLRNSEQYMKCKLEILEDANSTDGARKSAMQRLDHYRIVMQKILAGERRQLHTFRNKKDYDDDVITAIEHRIDLEAEQVQREGD